MNSCLLCGQQFIPEISFLQIILPNKKREDKICCHCLSKFELLGNTRCLLCSKNLNIDGVCRDCQGWQSFYRNNTLKNHALYCYNSFFHDLMVNYKRYGDYVLYQVLQELCYQELKNMKYDLYVPVPTSPEHLKKRQFDTVSAIYADIVPLTPLLKKNSGSGAQGEKNRQERLLSPQSFLIAKDVQLRENISKGKILLLDDIYTTGRTLYHARDKLQEKFPGAAIESFSICR